MGIEGHDDRSLTELPRLPPQLADNRLVAKVDAVESPQGNNGSSAKPQVFYSTGNLHLASRFLDPSSADFIAE
jgi:hypothetical protein